MCDLCKMYSAGAELNWDICDACNGDGYLFVSFSSGLKADDVYNEPHIERCDQCQRFSTDLLALKYVCDQAVANTDH